jgi:flagellin
MSSIQTNVSALFGQENLRVNNEFQARTIARLTSGYRINSSADDAAGLAIANKYRSDIVELQQGVRNANDGISALQIIDGGLANISRTLDRLKTLATQSASTTFTGNRNTLNTEYQALLAEITRQANNIGLVSGGQYNTKIQVYIGGGNTQANAQVSIDLSGANNRVDAASLGIATTSVAGGGSTLGATNTVNTLNSSTATFLAAAGRTQAFTFRIYDTNLNTTGDVSVTITGDADGLSASEALTQLNSGLSQYGIVASANSSGYLTFASTRAFSVSVSAPSSGTDGIATGGATAENQGVYYFNNAAYTANTNAQTLTFQNASGTALVTLAASTTQAQAISLINAQTAAIGIFAVSTGNGNGISIQSASNFSISANNPSGGGGVIGTGLTATVNAPDQSATATGAAQAAISAITSAISYLGLVQGRVGTGQNKLQYAVNLATSQITNFAAAESRIRDADIAAEAANLTKAQVLQQASLAALAQANAAPQAVLSLLRG